jgi:hypothetical protein
VGKHRVPPVHSRFKPGQSGNPGGKPAGILTKDKVAGILGKFAGASREQLQEVIQNPKSTMMEIMIASVMARAAKEGDPHRLEFLLQRSIGKVSDMTTLEVKHWTDDLKTIPLDTLKQISKGEE